MKNKEQIAGYAKSGFVRILAIGSQFVLIGMISRYLSVESTGQYASSISIASIVAIVITFGQMAAVIKSLPEMVRLNDTNGMSKIITRSISIVLLSALVMFLPIVVFSYFATGSLTSALIASGLGIGLGLLAVNGAIARSYGAIFMSESAKAVIWRLAAICTIGIATWLSISIVVTHVLFVAFFAMIISVVVTIFVFAKKYSLDLFKGQQILDLHSVRIDTMNWILQSLQTLILNIDVILVGMLIGLQESGVYFVLTRMASLVSMPLSVTNPVIQPVLGRIAKTNGVSASNRSIKMNARTNIASAVAIVLAMMIFSESIYSLLSGETMTPHILLIFSFLLFSQLVNCCVGPTSFSTQLFDVRKKALKILLLCLFGMVTSIAILADSHGIIGVAAAACLWRVLQNIWTFLLVWKDGGLNLITGSYQRNVSI